MLLKPAGKHMFREHQEFHQIASNRYPPAINVPFSLFPYPPNPLSPRHSPKTSRTMHLSSMSLKIKLLFDLDMEMENCYTMNWSLGIRKSETINNSRWATGATI